MHGTQLSLATCAAWHRKVVFPGHRNAMKLFACDLGDGVLHAQLVWSVDGGFIVEEGAREPATTVVLPHPFTTVDQLPTRCAQTGPSISDLMLPHEGAFRREAETRARAALVGRRARLSRQSATSEARDERVDGRPGRGSRP